MGRPSNVHSPCNTSILSRPSPRATNACFENACRQPQNMCHSVSATCWRRLRRIDSAQVSALTVGALAAASESCHRRNQIGSTAWPLGGLPSTEPGPRSADSYKRWLERSHREGRVAPLLPRKRRELTHELVKMRRLGCNRQLQSAAGHGWCRVGLRCERDRDREMLGTVPGKCAHEYEPSAIVCPHIKGRLTGSGASKGC